MQKQEFEKLAGYEVSQQTYHDIIEPMYLATDLPKEAFVKVVDFRDYGVIQFQDLLKSLREKAVYLKSITAEVINASTMKRISSLMDTIDVCMFEYYGGKKLKLEWAINEAGKPYPSALYVADYDGKNVDYYNLVVF